MVHGFGWCEETWLPTSRYITNKKQIYEVMLEQYWEKKKTQYFHWYDIEKRSEDILLGKDNS